MQAAHVTARREALHLLLDDAAAAHRTAGRPAERRDAASPLPAAARDDFETWSARNASGVRGTSALYLVAAGGRLAGAENLTPSPRLGAAAAAADVDAESHTDNGAASALPYRVADYASFDATTPSEVSGNVPHIRFAKFQEGEQLLAELAARRAELQERIAAGEDDPELTAELTQIDELEAGVAAKRKEIQDSLLHLHEFAMAMEPVDMPSAPAEMSAEEIDGLLNGNLGGLLDDVMAIRADRPSEETGHVPGVRIMAMKKADRLLGWLDEVTRSHPELAGDPRIAELQGNLQGKLDELASSFNHLDFGGRALAQVTRAHPSAPVGAAEGVPAGDDLPAGTQWLHTNVGGWPVTSELSDVRITDQGISFAHTKSGEWPANAGGAAGNLWVVVEIDGKPYAATVEWLKPGQTSKAFGATSLAGLARALGPHAKREPLASWVPRPGEKIGFFVSTPARMGSSGLEERSNVVWTNWP